MRRLASRESSVHWPRRPAALLVSLFLLAAAPAAGLAAGWSERAWSATDFDKHTVPLSEIISGGPGKDGIPSIDAPRFAPAPDAAGRIEPLEPVILLRVGDDARIYPLQILTYHEIVNDVVGEIPMAVTFCPLCNAAIVFERRVDGMTLEFGTTGLLRHSDLVMYDRQTESWWQQFSGEAIVGALAGKVLTTVPAEVVSFEAASRRYPRARVLSRDTGYSRPYGTNPYPGYDSIEQTPFLFRGDLDGRLPPMERVLGVSAGGAVKIYPHKTLGADTVINDTVGEAPVLVVTLDEARSALDSRRFSEARLVASARAYSRIVDGTILTFELDAGQLVDRETKSRWNRFGEATAGSLAGARLTLIEGGSSFAFSWLAFNPGSEIYEPPD